MSSQQCNLYEKKLATKERELVQLQLKAVETEAKMQELQDQVRG